VLTNFCESSRCQLSLVTVIWESSRFIRTDRQTDGLADATKVEVTFRSGVTTAP